MAKSREMAQSATGRRPRRPRWQALTKALFDDYRPELHYMRGPGPKWHEKHELARQDLSPVTDPYGTARTSH